MNIANKIKKFLKKFQSIPVDPSIYGDERAQQVNWTPNQGGGANFKTAYLDFSERHKVVLKKSLGAKLFGLIFVGMGMIPVYIGITKPDSKLVLIGLVFVVVGGFLSFFSRNKFEFDTIRSRFTHNSDTYRFEQVVAIQIIEEWVRSSGKNRHSYYSWELNIILDSNERLTVLDHGDLKAVREDAKKLAQVMNVQVWDASQDYLKRHVKKVA